MFNTPSGTDKTSLDKFILHYVNQGYDWMDGMKHSYCEATNEAGKHCKNNFDKLTHCPSDILFFHDDESILAAYAQFNDKNWICGFNIIKLQ